MARLLRELPKELLSRREVWAVGNSTQLLVAVEDEKSSIHVLQSGIESISEFFLGQVAESRGIKCRLVPSIDCQLLEIYSSDLEEYLQALDAILLGDTDE